MYDLDRQLSDLASFIDGEVEAVTVSEVSAELRPTQRLARVEALSSVASTPPSRSCAGLLSMHTTAHLEVRPSNLDLAFRNA